MLRPALLRCLSVRARILALLPLAALGVHQLRYLLAFGQDADHELAVEGHRYLSGLSPLCVVLAATVAAELIVRVARARPGAFDAKPRYRLVGLAAATAAALVAIYVAQELLEGLLSTGHPGGLEGVFEAGGWWSLPIATSFGIAIALFAHGAAAAVAFVAARRSTAPLRHAARAPLRPLEVQLPRLSPLAAAAPGRAPPGIALTF